MSAIDQAAVAAANRKRPWSARIGEIALAMAQATDQGLIPRRPFKAPELPPGVLPRGVRMACDSANANAMYGYLNSASGVGFCGLGFPGYPYLSELAQRSEYRAPTETLADEATREWVNLTGADDKKLKELRQWMEDYGVRELFRDMMLYDGLFGRGQLYIDVKGSKNPRTRALPLVIDNEGRGGITKGKLNGFKAIEPIWTTPWMYNSQDATAPDFYKPQAWYVIGVQTHASRLLTFVSRPVPDMLKPSYNFSGMSLSQLIEPYVIRWLKTVDSVNRMISNFSVLALATNLASTLEDDGPGGDGLLKRAQLFNLLRDNRGLMMLDKDSEDLIQKNTPLSGLSELQAQAQEHMAAPTHIPLVKLTGITPAGLNANSDGEIKVFYDHVGAGQENNLSGHLKTVLKCGQLHLWGKVNPDIKAEWVPLDSPTDKEQSEMRKADGDRDTGYVSSGIVSPDEVRERLRMDPKSGYAFIQGDAPPSPLEQEAALGEGGKDADHERGEAAAETAATRAEKAAQKQHQRDKDLARAKPPKK